MKALEYTDNLFSILKSTEVKDKYGKIIDFEDGIKFCIDMFKAQVELGGKVLFIGNGGSSAIASHMAIDYLKNGDMPALCFTDGALLTCISNDYGYEAVFEKPLTQFAQEQDVLVAISSSGKSQNILNGVKAAQKKGSRIITLSGFENTNSLKSMGDINIYVPSYSYGYVELCHQIILHMILDIIILDNN